MSYHPEILPHLRGFAENGRWWPVSQHHSCRALVEADGCKGISKVWFRVGRFKFKKVDWKQSQPKSVIYSGLTIQKGILSFNQFCSLFLVATGMTLPFAQIIPLDTPSSMSFIPHLQTTLSYSICEKPNAQLQVAKFKQADSSKFECHLISFHPFSGQKAYNNCLLFISLPFASSDLWIIKCNAGT